MRAIIYGMKKAGGQHHGHGHEHGEKSNIGLAFGLNLVFTVIELVGGVLTNSVAIISDAVHDFGDSLSLAMAWYFQKLSRKGRGERYSYGYKRFSLLGAVITSAVLVAGSVYILSEAIPRFFDPQETNAAGMFGLAILGIVVNGFAVLKTRKAKSINERVVSLHLLEDVLGWAAILVGSAVMYFTGWTVIDPILSVGIACFVMFNACRSIKQVVHILLQGSPSGAEQKRIAGKIGGVKGVKRIHDLHIWSMDEDYWVLTVHIEVEREMSMKELAKIKYEVRELLMGEGIRHATIEFETRDEVCGLEGC